LFGERTTGSADLSSRHDPVTSWPASTGLDATEDTARPGARSSVDKDDVIVTSLAWRVVSTVTGVV